MVKGICGSINGTDDKWRLRTDNELNTLIKNQNIRNHIGSLGIGWFGHMVRTDNQRLVNKAFKWKPIGNRAVGDLKLRWEDDK